MRLPQVMLGRLLRRMSSEGQWCNRGGSWSGASPSTVERAVLILLFFFFSNGVRQNLAFWGHTLCLSLCVSLSLLPLFSISSSLSFVFASLAVSLAVRHPAHLRLAHETARAKDETRDQSVRYELLSNESPRDEMARERSPRMKSV